MQLQLTPPTTTDSLAQWKALNAASDALRTLRREEEHLLHLDTSLILFPLFSAGLGILIEQRRREGYLLTLVPRDECSTSAIIDLNDTDEAIFRDSAEQLSRDPQRPSPNGLIQIWQWMIAELVDNVNEHARTSFCAIANSVGDNGYSLVIADGGISIPVAYRNAGLSHGDDCEDVKHALQGQSTKTVEDRGTGLPTIHKIVTEGLNGSLRIFSGNASLFAHNGGVNCDKLTSYWAGTMVAISVPSLPHNALNLYDYLK